MRILGSERAIYALVALFVLLGVLYSVTTPLFEAGDEVWHYPYVQWVARGNGLPVQDPAQKQLWEQEGGQPPLYYLAMAAATFWIDTRDLTDRLWRNPYARIGVPLAYGNKNMIVHTAAENFPWAGTTLAVHLIRLLSVLLSAGTVWLTYKLALELQGVLGESRTTSPENTLIPAADRRRTTPRENTLALAAAGFVAFNPMFLFISASVNNDALAALTGAGALYLILRWATRGVTRLRLVITGIVCGLALLSKVSNSALLVVGLAVLVWLALRQRRAARTSWLRTLLALVRDGLLFGLPILFLMGWWFLRNYQLYGDPLAFNVWLQIAGARPPQTLLGLLDEFQGFRISFWGNFGGVNVIAPEWVYTLLDLFTLLAVLGLILGARRRLGTRWRVETFWQNVPTWKNAFTGGGLPALTWIPALHVLVVFVALVRWTLLTYASQGRLMFPAIAALGILTAFGMAELAKFILQIVEFKVLERDKSEEARTYPENQDRTIENRKLKIEHLILVLPGLMMLFLLGFALAAPFWLIAPVYAQPSRLGNEAQVPNPVHIRFDAGDSAPELVGFEAARFVKPGEDLPLTLYWRTDAPVADNLAMFVHVYDARGNLIGQWDAYPGNGLAPPRLWQPGEIVVDQYRVPVRPPDPYPPVGRIEVGMVRVGSSRPLAARNPDGQEIAPTLATFKFAQPVGLPADAIAFFDDAFRIVNLGVGARRGTHELTFDTRTPGKVALKPGDTLNVFVTLQAPRTPETNYTLFAHVVDAKGTIVAQRDSEPQNGTYPTTLWDPNEQVSVNLMMAVPRDAPMGPYTLEFGMYRSADVQRVPIVGKDWGSWQVRGDHLVAPVTLEDGG